MKNAAVTLMLLTLLTARSVAQTQLTEAQSEAGNDTRPHTAPASQTKGPANWYGRIGVAGIIYHPAANVAAGGASVPGASATVSNNVTVLFDAGYHVTNNIAVSLMAGIPPKPKLSGTGTIAPYGELGSLWY